MKLSIIVPIYNVEPYLRRCIDSILAQTFTDFELILVDDGSPDNCPSICDEYAAKDPRIVVIHKENGGISDARNAGIDIAKGEYIGFVDSDDWIDQRMYEELIQISTKENVDIVCCAISNCFSNNEIKVWPELDQDVVYNRDDIISHLYPDIRRIICLPIWNKVFKKELFKTLRFPTNLMYEDEYIMLEYLNNCNMVYVCHKAFYNYTCDRQGSLLHSAISEKNYGLLDLTINQYNFYLREKNREQLQYILHKYVTFYIKLSLEIGLFHNNLQATIVPYKKFLRSNFLGIIRCKKICSLMKATLIVSFISPKIAYKICRKYFPECLFGPMR